jgi:hypothetical protein
MPKQRTKPKMTFDAIGRDLFPGERAAAKAFAARYAGGTDQRGREQVRQEQQRVMAEVRRAVLDGEPLDSLFYKRVQAQEQTRAAGQDGSPASSIPLLPLSAFQDAHPALAWTSAQSTAVVPLREGERFVVQLEQSGALSGYGPWRNDELANQGIDCCEEDAKSFAQGLLNAINDQLSHYELAHLVATFSAELERREAERQAALVLASK